MEEILQTAIACDCCFVSIHGGKQRLPYSFKFDSQCVNVCKSVFFLSDFFLFVCPNGALRMFAGCYVYDNQDMQQSDLLRITPLTALSLCLVVNLGGNVKYSILLGSDAFLLLKSQLLFLQLSVLQKFLDRSCPWLSSPQKQGAVSCSYLKLGKILHEEVIITFLRYCDFQSRNNKEWGSQSFPVGKSKKAWKGME